MKIQELMDRIKMSAEAQKYVCDNLIEDEQYQELKKLFYEDNKQFFDVWIHTDNHLQWILTFSLQTACDVYEIYKENGISDTIFNDTFYDITIWCEECYRKYGFYGLEEAKWIANSINMKLFRLGRLQFEPVMLEEPLIGRDINLAAGSQVLNVHIPAGEKMDYAACLKSFEMAKEFFGDSYVAYMCDSWLLSPVLKDFLPGNSNIVKFQNLFEVIKVYRDYPQGEGRIFKDVREDKENYPEESVLQREAKKYILAGNDLGIGVGAFYK